MTSKFIAAFMCAIALTVSAALFGWAVVLYSPPPDGGAYVPVGCASVGWTLGFTLGFALLNHSPTQTNHSPNGNSPPKKQWIPTEDGVGGWLDQEYKEKFDGQRS